MTDTSELHTATRQHTGNKEGKQFDSQALLLHLVSLKHLARKHGWEPNIKKVARKAARLYFPRRPIRRGLRR